MAITIDHNRCVGCGICIEMCSSGALYNKNGKTCVNVNCIGCGECVSHCICAAISFSGNPVKTRQVNN